MKDAAADREMAEMAAEEARMLEEQAEELEEGLKVTIHLKSRFLKWVHQSYP